MTAVSAVALQSSTWFSRGRLGAVGVVWRSFMATPADQPTRGRPAAVPFILVTVMLDILGIGLIVPVLPRLIESLLQPGDYDALLRWAPFLRLYAPAAELGSGAHVGDAAIFFGTFSAVYALMQVLFAPILGALSDRFGRRVVLLSSLFGAALDYLLLAFAPTLGWLFIGRVLAGITGASYSTATSYITDVTPPEKRASAFGLLGSMFGVGFILGPTLGGVLGDYGLRAPFFAAATLNALNLLYGLFVLPESLAPEHRRPFDRRRATPLGALKNLGRSPMLIGMTGTLVCIFLAQQILYNVWALFCQVRFDWSPSQVGLSLAAVGLASGLVQGGVVRVAIPRLGERRSVVVALVFAAAGFTAYAFATQGWMMYVVIFPFALQGLAGPAAQALLTREVKPSEQGELQGSLSSLQGLSSVVGPLISSALFARFAPLDASPRFPGMPFLAAAGLNVLGLVLALLLFARLPAKPVTS
jgi:MFS transporter, DHA1 family, tetracycline resistance protein